MEFIKGVACVFAANKYAFAALLGAWPNVLGAAGAEGEEDAGRRHACGGFASWEVACGSEVRQGMGVCERSA